MARNRTDEQRARLLRAEVEAALRAHPLLQRMAGKLVWCVLPHHVSARVVDAEYVQLNLQRRHSPAEWLWWIGHARLHIALGHPWDERRSDQPPAAFAIARCLVVNDLLFQLGIGKPPTVDGRPLTREPLPDRHLDRLIEHLQQHGIPDHWRDSGGVEGGDDLLGTPPAYTQEELSRAWGQPFTREHCASAFAEAIRSALADTIDRAGGAVATDREGQLLRSPAVLAMRWIRSHLPVIGALLDRYRVIEDVELCRRLGVHVAAICDGTEEIYLNKANITGEAQYRFVIAHELLHAGLRHGDRCGGRDPEFWNAACDFVINGWLVEMDIGRPPAVGGLYDPGLRGLSAEQVYDQIHATLSRKDLTGFAADGDIRHRTHGLAADWADLDSWCRNVLLNGLELHQHRRGELPLGLIEAIRSLAQPPIAWDVELARWFEREIGVVPRRRSYARASRRQMATPDIPRPRWVPDDDSDGQAAFATVIDTSGSMDRTLLGKALGAVASYAQAREVRRVRVVFCDATAYDAGWIAPEQLLERIEVRGRGGTVLQAGIDLIAQAQDFPRNGPLLIITDGHCDRFTCPRTHAILTPAEARLPFKPAGEVFRLR